MPRNVRRIPRAPDTTALPRWLFKACKGRDPVLGCNGDMYYEVSVTQGHWFREYTCLACSRSVSLKKALREIERYALRGGALKL
jgi:hypothetical protein